MAAIPIIVDSGTNAYGQVEDTTPQCDASVDLNCSLLQDSSPIPEVEAPPLYQPSTSGNFSYLSTSTDNSTLVSGPNIGDLVQGVESHPAESCCVAESGVNGVKLQTRIVTIKNIVPPNSFQAFGVPCDSDELITGGGYLVLESGLEIKGSVPFVGTNSEKSWMIAVKNNEGTDHQVEIQAVCAKLIRPPEDILGSP